MKGKLSPEAAHAKYLYNKKYQDKYWEKKAARASVQENGETVRVEVSIDDKVLKEGKTIEVSVSRNGHSDDRYIRDLERANKTLNSENRRLTKLLMHYQEIISIGLKSAGYGKEEVFGNQ